jgi:hypothetical protein
MTKYGYNNKGFLSMAMSFYTHMLYNLGVLAARLQVSLVEFKNFIGLIGNSPPFLSVLFRCSVANFKVDNLGFLIAHKNQN